jgi:hypothetical protein
LGHLPGVGIMGNNDNTNCLYSCKVGLNLWENRLDIKGGPKMGRDEGRLKTVTPSITFLRDSDSESMSRRRREECTQRWNGGPRYDWRY